MPSPLDRRLVGESRVARVHLGLACLLGVLSAVVIVAQAALLADVIYRAAMRHASLSQLTPTLIALSGVLIARALITGAFELSGRWGAIRVMSELRGRLADELLLRRPERSSGVARTGDLASTAVQGVDALEAYFAGYLPQLILACIVPPAVIGWVLEVDPVTAAILAFTVPLLVVFMVLIGKGARAQARGRWQALGLLGAHFLDVVQGLPTLRAYGREDAQERTLAEVGDRYRSETMATLRIAFLSALVLELCAMIGTALVAATIGLQLVDGALGLQAGLTVLLLAPELYGPLRQVGQQFHSGADASTASERIFGELEGAPAISRAPLPSPAANPALEPIVLRGVSYEYPQRRGDVVRDISLRIAPGEITALVGASGAGKSTIAQLLMRLSDPDSGEISCGGVDLREMDLDAWREQIAWVPQRPTLFTGTIATNIALYVPRAGREEVWRAARAAGAEAFIEELAEGLETEVGEGARRLSAGQAQRIALARAFLSDRPLLLADEPTAHLDDESARTVSETIARRARGRTTVLIVHEPLLTELADEVYVMREGRLARSGSEALAARGHRAGLPIGATA